MRWSRAAKLPSLIRRRRVGWPTSSPVNGAMESISVLVSSLISSSWSVVSRWASSSYAELGIDRPMPTPRLCRRGVLRWTRLRSAGRFLAVTGRTAAQHNYGPMILRTRGSDLRLIPFSRGAWRSDGGGVDEEGHQGAGCRPACAVCRRLPGRVGQDRLLAWVGGDPCQT